jgi:hypothetical protein
VNLGGKEREMAKRLEGETYIEMYRRKLGPIGQYSTMEVKQLGRKFHRLQTDFGATLVFLRDKPDDFAGNEMLRLIEPHYNAALKEIRRDSR